MEYREFKAKTVDEAITLASTEFGCASTEKNFIIQILTVCRIPWNRCKAGSH